MLLADRPTGLLREEGVVPLQERPVCFHPRCTEIIEHNPVFEAPCGHEDCPSAVFHGVCLMEWREFKEDMEREIKRFIEQHSDPGDEEVA